MIMMGLEFTGQAPFHTVYLHGMIRDKGGRKMSKTYGNVIDPLEVMDEMGTDALRFTLLVGSAPGNDVNLSLKRVEANRNFANKIWNAGRFVLASVQELETRASGSAEAVQQGYGSPTALTLADAWVHARLRALVRDVQRLFQNYLFGEAGSLIYDFFWSEFADWYVEIAKLQIAAGGEGARATARHLVRVLDTCLRLLHPYTPFVTEEIWGHLKKAAASFPPAILPTHSFLDAPGQEQGWEEALIVARWPEPVPEEAWETKAIADFSLVMEIVRALRNARAEKNVKPGQRIPAMIAGGAQTELLRQQARVIAALAHLDQGQLAIEESLAEKPADAVALVVGAVEIYLPLAGLVDVKEERVRLEKELKETQAQIDRLVLLLASSFNEKAPQTIVQKEREKLTKFKEKAEKLKQQLADLS
jgi:valyl-tRNA synthetase